jgi:hypothetical protein
MLEVHYLTLMMGEMFTSDASEVEKEDDGGKRGTSSKFLSTTGGTETMMKYLVV